MMREIALAAVWAAIVFLALSTFGFLGCTVIAEDERERAEVEAEVDRRSRAG